jgi:hypothetical protein
MPELIWEVKYDEAGRRVTPPRAHSGLVAVRGCFS